MLEQEFPNWGMYAQCCPGYAKYKCDSHEQKTSVCVCIYTHTTVQKFGVT